MVAEIERGQRALDEADWETARDAFTQALAVDAESGDALDGLSQAVWWLGEWPRGRELRERAFARHRATGRRLEAARAAMWIANENIVGGNRAAWNGWMERAAGQLEGVPPCADHGWLVITRGRREAEPGACARACTEALEIARLHGDIDLEVFALSQLGRALVTIGRVDEGFARLDEAMVAVTAGEPRSFFAVCDTCCNMLTTCENAVEIERLTQWCRATDEVSRKLNGLTLYALCRFAYASVLIAMGRWDDAEKELRVGLDSKGGRTYPAYVANHVMTKLAELRVMQGRIGEAEELLAGTDDQSATRAVALLRLAKGDAESAARLLERRLSQIEPDVVQSAAFLALLVDAHLAANDIASAEKAAARLAEVAELTRRGACEAASIMALGLVALAKDEDAWASFDDAQARFTALEMPYHAARARLGAARALAKSDPDEARDIARNARTDLERIGAARDVANASELLRALGVGAGPGKRTAGILSAREDEVLAQLALGLSNADIGSRLFISPKTVEHHVGRILSKLGLKNRAAAAAYMIRSKVEESGRK